MYLRWDFARSVGTPKLESVEAGLADLHRELARGDVERVRVYIGFAARVDLEVAVDDLPSHGYVALGVRRARGAPPEAVANQFFELETDDRGRLSLLEKRSGARFDGLLALRDRGERGDSYTTDPLDDEARAPGLRDVRVETTRDGPLQVLEIRGVLPLLRVEARQEPRLQQSDELVELVERAI